MKHIFLTFFLVCGLSNVSNAEIYKWVDEKGITHYGDLVPEKYSDKKKPTAITPTNPTPSEQQAALERLEKQKNLEQQFRENREKDQRVRTKKLAESKSREVEQSSKSETCESEWRAYYDSLNCFAEFRLHNGGIRPEAFSECKEVKRPFSKCR